ncbi:trehalose operon repressor [Marinococcus halophilus]|uniref:Trehalose operon repressor n=1 Tax=Marinococcus halophilus TaxID=1371 RepID=A0A510YBF0_MARHA|nr:trehalose operon repressor [Marinococcus halophilus]OZT79040.1 trehalose operon repressor [Marinococcus halophilus]GEK59971.1 HTH-type transcriptional regulator TreR [Marinococcus halophilus]
MSTKRKYLDIYEEIAHGIRSEQFKPHALLPSEHELTSMYDTSRETIRKALNLLSEHGYIQKIQGKGSVVLETGRFDFPVSGLVSFKELAEQTGSNSKTHVHSLTLSPVPAALQHVFEAEEEAEQVWEVKRQRKMDGENIVLDIDYLLERWVPGLTEDICADSIYDYVENKLELVISFARKEITIEKPTHEDGQLLDLYPDSSIAVVRNYVYLDNAELFQYTESRHRSDKFRFIDFARRHR